MNAVNVSEKKCELLIIGGSAGSLSVIIQMLQNIDFHLTYPVVIVVHRKANSESILPVLLQQYTKIEVTEPEDKADIKKNKIYVAPADYHLLFESKDLVSLELSEKVNYSRPSIDVSFKSAAEIFGSKLTAVLLSGASADGVEGLKYVQKNGGKVWIQHPETAEVDYMPRIALEEIHCDWIFAPNQLAEKIKHYTNPTL